MRARHLIPALVCLATALAQDPARPAWTFQEYFRAGLDALRDGRYDECVALYERCRQFSNRAPTAAYNIACAYSLKGEPDLALEWLSTAAAENFRGEFVERDPDLVSLHEHPEFAEFVRGTAERIARSAVNRRSNFERARASLAELERLAGAAKIHWADGHARMVNGAWLHPQGDQFTTRGPDGVLHRWDAETLENLGFLGPFSTAIPPERVDVAYSRDGRFLLVHDKPTARATLFDGRATDRPIAVLGDAELLVVHAALSPDGAHVAVADDAGSVRFWSTREQRFAAEPIVQTARIESLAYSADGGLLLTACHDSVARLWDPTTGAEVWSIGDRGRLVWRAGFKADGKRLWTFGSNQLEVWQLTPKPRLLCSRPSRWHHNGGCVSDDGSRAFTFLERGGRIQWQVWDMDGGRVDLAGAPERLPKELTFSADGHYLAAGSYDGQLSIWNARTGERTQHLDLLQPWREWNVENQVVFKIGFAPDGRSVFATCPYWVLSQVPVDGSAPRVIKHSGTVLLLGTDATRQQFLAGGNLGLAFLAGLDFESTRREFAGHVLAPITVDVHPSGATATTGFLVPSYDKVEPARRWAPSTGRDETSLPVVGNSVQTIRHSPDGTRLALARALGALQREGRELYDWQIVEATGNVTTLSGDRWLTDLGATWSRDGKRLLTASHRRYAQLWDVERAALVLDRIPAGVSWWTNLYRCRPIFDHDQARVVAAALAPTGSIEVLDAATGDVVARPERRHTLPIRELTLSPDGRTLASSSVDRTTVLWDTGNWQPVRTLRHGEPIFCAAFHPSGGTLITGGNGGGIWCWDLAQEGPARRLAGHSAAVRQIAFDQQLRWLVTCSADGTARLFDADTLDLLYVLHGHSAEVREAAFVPGTDRLLTCSTDGTVRIWDCTAGRLLLTRVEYFGGNWLTFTQNGYYDGTPQAAEWARITVHDRRYPLSSYAKVYHRPDLVAAALRGDEPPPPTFEPRAPEVDIVEPGPWASTVQSRSFAFEVRAEDAAEVTAIQITQDERELPSADLSLRHIRQRGADVAVLRLQLRFADGENETRLRVRAVNRHGILSALRLLTVRYEKPEADLYVLGIAVQDYDRDALDLKFTKKDRDDLVALLQAQKGQLYREVHVSTLTNEEVTVGALRRASKNFLRAARPQDTILVFVAGHGTIDEVEDYYLLTPSATPEDPEDGIPRRDLDRLVTWKQLDAGRRLLLLDTCNSGTTIDGARGGERGRSPYGKDRKQVDDGGTGLYILSASRESGVALEREGNGLFTRAVLDALRGAADRNRDGLVKVNELLPYVDDSVRQASAGRQKPVISYIEGGEGFALTRVAR